MSSKTDKQTRTIHDWLTVVFDIGANDFSADVSAYEKAYQLMCSVFGIDWFEYDVITLKRGIYEYPHAVGIFQGTVIIGWLDDGSSVMVQCSGRGLRNIDAEYVGGLTAFIGCLRTYEGHWHVTRWDIARDLFDCGSRYSPAHVANERAKGNLVSRISYFQPTISTKVQRPKSLRGRERELLIGSTTYLGRNPFQLRVYNKLNERFVKTGIDFQYSSWYRWELQINGDKANYYFQEWINTGRRIMDAWKLIMKANFRFVVNHDEDVNMHRHANRLATARWWSDLVNIDDHWDHAPALERMQTPAKTQKFYNKVVSKHAAMRLNYLVRGYLKNGVKIDDAKRLARVVFSQELERSVDDNQTWVVANENLYKWRE